MRYHGGTSSKNRPVCHGEGTTKVSIMTVLLLAILQISSSIRTGALSSEDFTTVKGTPPGLKEVARNRPRNN